MKKNLLAISLLLVAISIFCAKKEKAGLKLLALNWTDNEICQYQVLIAGQMSGTYKTTIKLAKIDEVPVVELNAVTDIKSVVGEAQDIATVTFRQDNFQPLSANREMTSKGTKYCSTINYTKDKASIKMSTPMGEKSLDLPITANHYDNDEVTTLLRAVDLKQNEEKEINVISGLAGSAIPIKIKALGTEKLVVPAGEFECNKYQLNLVGRQLNIWYEKTDARRMIKYLDVASNMAMELLP